MNSKTPSQNSREIPSHLATSSPGTSSGTASGGVSDGGVIVPGAGTADNNQGSTAMDNTTTSQANELPAAKSAATGAGEKLPAALLFIGMAGSGKTSLLQRINAYLSSLKKKRYVLNLDPATRTVPYKTNIDIRDTVNYKKGNNDLCYLILNSIINPKYVANQS